MRPDETPGRAGEIYGEKHPAEPVREFIVYELVEALISGIFALSMKQFVAQVILVSLVQANEKLFCDQDLTEMPNSKTNSINFLMVK